MAAINRFYIGQIEGGGLETDLRPYEIPDNAFALLNNAYVFRGRVKKRFGGQLMYGSDVVRQAMRLLQRRRCSAEHLVELFACRDLRATLCSFILGCEKFVESFLTFVRTKICFISNLDECDECFCRIRTLLRPFFMPSCSSSIKLSQLLCV